MQERDGDQEQTRHQGEVHHQGEATARHVSIYSVLTCPSTQCSRVTLQIDQKCKPTKTEIPEKKCSPRYNRK